MACARRLTSEARRLAIASIGLPGSVSSAVNSQRSASRSSNPQSKSRVRVPLRPLTTWLPSRKAAGIASVPPGRVTARSFRSRRSCFTRPAGMPSRSAASGSDSHAPTSASVAGSISVTNPMSHGRANPKHADSLPFSGSRSACFRWYGTASLGGHILYGDSGIGDVGGVDGSGGGDQAARLDEVTGAVHGQDRDQAAGRQPARRPGRGGGVTAPDEAPGVAVVARVLDPAGDPVGPEPLP